MAVAWVVNGCAVFDTWYAVLTSLAITWLASALHFRKREPARHRGRGCQSALLFLSWPSSICFRKDAVPFEKMIQMCLPLAWTAGKLHKTSHFHRHPLLGVHDISTQCRFCSITLCNINIENVICNIPDILWNEHRDSERNEKREDRARERERERERDRECELRSVCLNKPLCCTKTCCFDILLIHFDVFSDRLKNIGMSIYCNIHAQFRNITFSQKLLPWRLK